jgi:hypothetical protein
MSATFLPSGGNRPESRHVLNPPDIPKVLLILSYCGFGLFCLVSATRHGRANLGGAIAHTRTGASMSPLVPIVAIGLAGSLLLLKFALAGGQTMLAAVALGWTIYAVRHAAWRSPAELLLAAATAALVVSLAWWRIAPDPLDPLRLAVFAIVLAGAMTGLAASPAPRARTFAILPCLFLLAGCLLLIDLGGYRPGEDILRLLAHHWGALIGPALHLRAGLVPFYDVPLQYGLGPTVLIAAVCRQTDCWNGMEALVVVANLASALIILAMALATTKPRGLLWQAVVTVAIFAAVFLWTGAPVVGNSVLATPSVGGMRFLPLTMVACLLFFGRPRSAAAALVPAVLWSPECAVMSVAVFGLCESARVGFREAALRTGAIVLASYTGLVLLHRAVFGVWLDPAAFAEYVLHVPGPLPIDPLSDALLLIAVFGLGGWLLVRRSPDPVAARRDDAVTFLLFAVTSYWFGRSHPNNVCNLAPFIALVAIRALDRPVAARSSLERLTSFGLAASIAVLALSPWQVVPYDPAMVTDIHTIVGRFPALEPGLEQIRATLAAPPGLGIADFGPNYIRHPSETVVWTPMDPSSLWTFVPSDRRRLYIRRSEARLRRSGWAIADDEQQFLLDDLAATYVARDRYGFDAPPLSPDGTPTHYVAMCFDPRPEIAASIVGPPCPARGDR